MTGKDEVPKKFTVAYCDGCFDFLHYGHANQIRQAKETADYLVVWIHTDEEISEHKAAPIFLQEERSRMLRALKWTGKIIFDAPFSQNSAFLDDNKCDFCVHGIQSGSVSENFSWYRCLSILSFALSGLSAFFGIMLAVFGSTGFFRTDMNNTFVIVGVLLLVAALVLIAIGFAFSRKVSQQNLQPSPPRAPSPDFDQDN